MSESGVAPQRRELWLWVWSAIRPIFGWILAALGALALFLGWYGVSGEALTAKQLPYLVSGGLTGIALVIIAGVVLATEDIRRQLSRVDDLERKLDDLYGLFVEELNATPRGTTGQSSSVPARTAATLSALPNGTVYHRSSCALLIGKSEAAGIDDKAIRARKLLPCRVCDPPDIG